MNMTPERTFAESANMNEANAAFNLKSVISSKGFPPQKVVVYGVPGVGKTTFAATWPKPILLRTEDGAAALDIPTFPRLITTMDELSLALNALLREDHDFKTVIIDSLDWMEPFVWKKVCQEEGKESIESFGYGKGYVLVDTKWRLIQSGLEALRNVKKMHVLTIAHAVPQIFDPPDMESWMRYGIKLHKRAAALWTEWAELLLFLNYRASLTASKDGKVKASGTGERVIYTQERPAWLAKSRWPLSPEIYIGQDATWHAFHEELNKATNGEYKND